MPKRRGKKWIKSALHVARRRKTLRAVGYTPKLHRHRSHRKSWRVEPLHKGALHRRLGISEGQKIPMHVLQAAKKSALAEMRAARGNATAMKIARKHFGQVQIALNLRKMHH